MKRRHYVGEAQPPQPETGTSRVIRLKQPKLEERAAGQPVNQPAETKRLGAGRLLSILGLLGAAVLLALSWPLLARLPLGQPVVVPLWIMVLLILSSMLSLVATSLRLSARRARAKAEGKRHLSDCVFDVDWQWVWRDGNVDASSLLPLCPRCAYELTVDAALGHTAEHPTFHGKDVVLTCDNCAFEKHFDIGPNELLQRVIKEIHWRKRRGSYPEQPASPREP
jgi:hypothetical protein